MPVLSISQQTDCDTIVKQLHKEQGEYKSQSLAFFGVEFDARIASALMEYLYSCSENGHTLGELNLIHCSGNEHLNNVFQAAMELDSFSKIYIQGRRDPNFCRPSIDFLLGLPMKSRHRLRQLRLSVLTLTEQDTAAIRYALENTNNKNSKGEEDKGGRGLEYLSLSNIQFINDDAVNELCLGFQSNYTLKELSIVSCGLNDSNTTRVIGSLRHKPSLKILRLCWNQCWSEGLKAVVGLLRCKECHLELIDLQHQYKTSSDHNISNAAATRTSQSRMPIQNLLTGWDDDEIETTTDSVLGLHRTRQVSFNHSLKRLVLSSNNLQDEDMKVVASLLQRLPSLEELDLDSNGITSHGLEILAQHSKTTPSRLRILRLSMNPLGKESAMISCKALIPILSIHSELCTVTVFRSHEKGDRMLQHLMNINRAGRVLLRHTRTIPLSIWPMVLARLNQYPNASGVPGKIGCENGLYYLLRHGPVLLERSTPPATTATPNSDTKKHPSYQFRPQRKRRRLQENFDNP